MAAEWLTKYEEHNINAMCDLVNFVLKCTGTDLKVDVHDIEDVDNVPNKLNDLQEEYQAQSITEYPLISKAKKYRSFQTILSGFFDSLVRTIHSSTVLYSDSALIENIQVWITAMSSASIRPFRHTATIISLAMMTTLCHLAREVSSTLSNVRKQLESEKKKKSVNKGRVSAMETKVQEHEKRLEIIDEALRDSFDTVFVHRYRDVDPKIRAECMNQLVVWTMTYKEMFFDGQYLRYLGWVLSDTVANTRSVVVHQLRRLYQNKDNIAGLRSFTERFRPRIVEMAARDSEIGVRATAIDLLDLIRDAGLLEPDDIDSIGRLVFDAESRVRKAAGRFFVANIQDVYDSTLEDVEEDDLNEFFADEDEDNFEAPKLSWIRYKCLADILQIYDGQEPDLRDEQGNLASRTDFAGAGADSRYVLATEAIYPHLKELDQWESLAGFLLYDHSQIPDQPNGGDTASSVKSLYKLAEGQEPILLEVLGCAVKLHIQSLAKSDTDKRGRKTKELVAKMEERQESNAHNLSQIIPQLLNKFGAVPDAASAVLRLEHLVNLDLIQDLQKDAASYSDLISNINKQFLTHSDQGVLAEATVAFLHARTSDELKESMEYKVQELWDDTTDTLRNVSSSKALDESQALSSNILNTLSNTLSRISNLATISDCTSILETARSVSKKQKRQPDPPVDVLLTLAKRGLREDDADDETNTMERELVVGSFKTLLIYFMWKIQVIKTVLSSGDGSLGEEYFDGLSHRRDSFVSTLTAIMQQRSGIDDLRISATTTLLDLQTAFGALRQTSQGDRSNGQSLDENLVFQTQGLAQEVIPETRSLISRIHDAAERYFAKKSNRKLEPAADDAPLDPESDIGLSSDEDEAAASNGDGDNTAARHTRSVLLAEQKLCKLTGKIVLAVVGRVLDVTGPDAGKLRQKLLKNKTRLGPNYKELLAYLEDGKAAAAGGRMLAKDKRNQGGAGPKSTGAAGATIGGGAKSAERVQDDEEDEASVQAEEDEEEDLQARGLLEDEREQREPRVTEDVALGEDDVMGD